MCLSLDPASFLSSWLIASWLALSALFLYSSCKSRQRQQALYDDYVSKIAKYHMDDANYEDKDKV